MRAFLVEGYAAGLEPAVADVVSRARSAGGSDVRHVRSAFVPEDEMVLHFFEGPSREAVAEALGRAGVVYDRIVEAREPGRGRGAAAEAGGRKP